MGDALVDVLHGEIPRGVFLAIGEDRDDHFGRSVGLGGVGEFAADVINRASDGIQQRGVSAWLVGFKRQRTGDMDVLAVVDRQIFVIEENQGEGGGHRIALVVQCGLLGGEEFVEAGNGGVCHGRHGTGAVEDECDFCFFHGMWGGLGHWSAGRILFRCWVFDVQTQS